MIAFTYVATVRVKKSATICLKNCVTLLSHFLIRNVGLGRSSSYLGEYRPHSEENERGCFVPHFYYGLPLICA